MRIGLDAHTVLVRGKYSALLMNLYRCRMQRVSLGVADLIDYLCYGQEDVRINAGGLEGDIIEKLMGRGFLSKYKAPNYSSYMVDSAYPDSPIVRNISFDLSVFHLDYVVDLALGCHESLGTYSIGILALDEDVGKVLRLVSEFISASPRIIVDVLVSKDAGRDFEGEIKSYEGRVRTIFLEKSFFDKKELILPGMEMGKLFCRGDFYRMLKMKNESFGCIYIDREGAAYPDLLEREFVAGDIRGLTVASLRNGIDRFIEYWSLGKDEREKCSECEYRYACPNTLAARSVREDLRSEPMNCGYQIKNGIWQ